MLLYKAVHKRHADRYCQIYIVIMLWRYISCYIYIYIYIYIMLDIYFSSPDTMKVKLCKKGNIFYYNVDRV